MSFVYYFQLFKKKQELLHHLENCEGQLQGIELGYLNDNQSVITHGLTSVSWQGIT